MGIWVQCPQQGASLSFLPQMGSTCLKVADRGCWRVNLGRDFLGSCATTFTQSTVSASCSSVVKLPSLVNSFRRTESGHRRSAKGAKSCRIELDGDGDMHYVIARHRIGSGHEQGHNAASRKGKVRSFVDEATACSSDLGESNITSVIRERSAEEAAGADLDLGEFKDEAEMISDRDTSARVTNRVLDQESYPDPDQRDDEGGEIGLGMNVEAESSPSVDLAYNYEDMKLGERKDWSIVDMKKLDLLRNFEYRHGSEKGVFVVQTMRVEHMKATEDLLVDSFAELMGGLLTYRPLLALTVRQYVRDRYACLPDAVTLVGLYAPAEDNVVMGKTRNEFSGNWLLAGTVELSFSDRGHPDIPAGPSPPPGSPYLCNMAVSDTYRRRGLGRQLLKAAEELAVLMGAQDLYLHCRMVDTAPLNMYQGAGYQIVATDSILSLLSFQRRRYLMRKRLPALTPITV